MENEWVGVENGLLGAEKGGEGQLESKMGGWVQKRAVGCKNGQLGVVLGKFGLVWFQTYLAKLETKPFGFSHYF